MAAKRTLRVLKWIGTTPAVAICSACEEQFTAPVTALKSVANAQESLTRQFTQHTCRTQEPQGAT